MQGLEGRERQPLPRSSNSSEMVIHVSELHKAFPRDPCGHGSTWCSSWHHRGGRAQSWFDSVMIESLKMDTGGKVLRKGKQNITSSSMCYNKHRAAQRFWKLNQNTDSSYTFLVGFQSFCERFILMPIGKLLVCEGIDN